MIHHFFLNYDRMDFGIQNEILNQCNLIMTRLIDYENRDLKNDWINIRDMIITNLEDNDD